jgi:hypothetical protein
LIRSNANEVPILEIDGFSTVADGVLAIVLEQDRIEIGRDVGLLLDDLRHLAEIQNSDQWMETVSQVK